MKRVVLTCVLGLLVAVPARADLIDPGMNLIGANGSVELTPNAPWVIKDTRAGFDLFNDGAASEAFADHDGGGYGLSFRAFVGNPPWDPTAGEVDVDFYQDTAGTPGVLYSLSGWWGAGANYSGFTTAGANVVFALDFLDAGNALLGSAELDLEAAGLTGDSRDFNWQLFTLSAIAPAGTAVVRARGSMFDGIATSGAAIEQALVTDQWSLKAGVVPEPATMALWGVGLGALALRRRFQRR